MESRHSIAWALLLACTWLSTLLILPLGGCSSPNEYQPPPPVEVTVALPFVHDVTIYMEETGTTEAVERVEINARVEGIIEDVLFEPNDEVEKDQVLFQLERRRYVAARDMAQAELDAKKVDREKAKIEFNRQTELFAKKATPETTLVAAKAELDGSEAAVLAAEAKLDNAQLDLDYTEVRSPIKGRVGKALVKKGNLVTGQPSTHLTTVISYDQIYANFSISERAYLEFLDKETREERKSHSDMVPLYLARATDTTFPFRGSFNFADLAVDKSTGTFAVRGIFPNPNLKIAPGLFVRIRAPVEQRKDALLVPESSTGFDQAGSYLLVVDANNTVQRRDITLGNKFGPMVVVADGLKADELIVVDGVQRSRPGAVVSPQKQTLTMDESLLNPFAEQPPHEDEMPKSSEEAKPETADPAAANPSS
ncbi:efflux transporter periplasmic adaptor subunit [Blastopirellula marina]|uniref:Efflux transporter periplasmic adaptor subunit n=1 Tax=Blastopirellula marina TaxID=124 RepID=A0A2S8FM20_9BACT|nr:MULTISPECIES: efflux RND transporter periplasmic adaptor subunit [Pirellulaceae]PQO33201.1 efflux transporter periplasmic adaptor subunit [Blastopirellula marina]RCS52290.1 efflux RND transporter periplasmic adaptor subunit [Bremerella cremea]